MMFKKLFSLRIKVFGFNLNRLIINLKKNNIQAQNFYVENVKTVCLDITTLQLKKAKKYFKEYNLNFEIIKYYGFCFLLNEIKKNIGLVCGVAVSLVLFMLSNLFIWQIQIYGLETILKEDVINCLNINKIQTKSQIDTKTLENNICDALNKISLCSVSVKGSCLVVNIKEKTTLNETTSEGENIVSCVNGVVKHIEIDSGTANVKVGQTVKLGDILILGSFKDINSKTVFCKARGKIIIESYVYGTSTLMFEEWVQQKTGNKIINQNLYLFGMNFNVKNENNYFEKYEEEKVEKYLFKNIILPIKIFKTIYYETIPVKIERTLEENEELFKTMAKNNAQNKLTNNMKILEQISFTSKIENGIIFSYGFKVEQIFNFN